MWYSDIFTDRFPRLRSAVFGVALAGLVAGLPVAGQAKIFLTVDEALALAFPDCEINRRTVSLTEEQLATARELSGGELRGALVPLYEAHCNGEYAGTAYTDTHRVRTLAETLMVVVDSEEKVRRIEILAFREPEEYIPRPIWYRQFTDRELAPDLALERDIRNVAGATLTARATTEAVRRVLALHRVIRGETPSSESYSGEEP